MNVETDAPLEGTPLIQPSTTDHPLYDDVVAACRTVFDPEIPVNIFDLGLVYTIEITAESDAAAQKAIDALAAAGFYGKLDNDKVKYKPVAAGDAAVEKLEVAGVHNCCGACTNAIKKAVTSVSGVTGTNVKAKEESFAIEGKFKPADVVKALLDAGFYVEVKK